MLLQIPDRHGGGPEEVWKWPVIAKPNKAMDGRLEQGPALGT